MTGSIISLNNIISDGATQTSQSSANQALPSEQQLLQELTQATQGDTYGPPYVLDLSPVNAAYANGGASAPDANTTGTANTSPQQSFWSDFKQLGQALQSGDLSAAQQAYASLSQLPGVQSALQNNPNSPLAQAISQIGSALQSGDLSTAQQAFSSFQQQTFSSLQQQAGNSSNIPHVGGHHHHHHGGGGSSQASNSFATSEPSNDPDSPASSSQVIDLLTGSGATSPTG